MLPSDLVHTHRGVTRDLEVHRLLSPADGGFAPRAEPCDHPVLFNQGKPSCLLALVDEAQDEQTESHDQRETSAGETRTVRAQIDSTA